MTDEQLADLAKGLSEAMRNALLADRSRGESAYSMRVSLGTLGALYRRGLVSRKPQLGALFCPHTNIKWPLTPDGLALRADLIEREAND
jgi:hypothetical protein